MDRPLTSKERLFIDAYLETWNANEAARRAGYKHAAAQSWKIKTRLAEYIEAEISRRAMGANEVLARLAAQARLNVAEFMVRRERPTYNSEGDYTGVEYIYEPNWEAIEQRGWLVKSVKNTPSGPAIEFHDAQKALEMIGKKLGLWRELVEHTGKDGEALQVFFYLPKREDEDAGDAGTDADAND